MTEKFARFLSDKVVSLILFIGAGVAFRLNLPHDYCFVLMSAASFAYPTGAKAANSPS